MHNYFMIRTDDGKYVGYWNGDMTAHNGISLNVPRALACTWTDPFDANAWVERISAQTGAHLTVVDRDGEDMTAAIDEVTAHEDLAEPCGLPCGHAGECRRDDIDDNAAWLRDMTNRYGHGGI